MIVLAKTSWMGEVTSDLLLHHPLSRRAVNRLCCVVVTAFGEAGKTVLCTVYRCQNTSTNFQVSGYQCQVKTPVSGCLVMVAWLPVPVYRCQVTSASLQVPGYRYQFTGTRLPVPVYRLPVPVSDTS